MSLVGLLAVEAFMFELGRPRPRGAGAAGLDPGLVGGIRWPKAASALLLPPLPLNCCCCLLARADAHKQCNAKLTKKGQRMAAATAAAEAKVWPAKPAGKNRAKH